MEKLILWENRSIEEVPEKANNENKLLGKKSAKITLLMPGIICISKAGNFTKTKGGSKESPYSLFPISVKGKQLHSTFFISVDQLMFVYSKTNSSTKTHYSNDCRND